MIAERIFVAAIVLYFVVIFVFRWRIRRSQAVRKLTMASEELAKKVPARQKIVKWGLIALAVGIVLSYSGYKVYSLLSPEKRFNKHLDQAAVFLGEENDEGAIIVLKNALKIRPRHERSRYVLGRIYWRLNQQDEALRQFKIVFSLDPYHRDTSDLLVNMYLSRQRYNQVVDVSRKVEAKKPESAEIYRIKVLVAQRKYKEVLKALAKAVEKYPEQKELYLLTGDVEAIEGRQAEAIKAYQKAIKIDFSLWKAHYAVGKLLVGRGEVEEGIKELQIARSLNEDFDAAGLSLSDIYLNQGRPGEAILSLKDILSREENQKEATYLIGVAYIQAKAFQDGINALEKVRGDQAKNPFFFLNTATAYYNLMDLDQAIKEIESCLELNPELIDAKRLQARIYYHKGEFGETYKILKRLRDKELTTGDDERLIGLSQKGDSLKQSAESIKKQTALRTARVRAQNLEGLLVRRDFRGVIKGAEEMLKKSRLKAPYYHLLGMAHLGLGERRPALEYFQKAYEQDQGNPVSLINIANIYRKEKRTKAAASLLEDHIQRYPIQSLPRIVLGEIYSELKEFRKAEKMYQEVVRITPGLFQSHLKLALLYQGKGEREKAVEYYKKTLSINSKEPLSNNFLAYDILEHKGDLQKALTMANTANAALPGSPAILDTLGFVYFHLGDYSRAIMHFSAAYDHNPHNPVIPYHMALAYNKMGRQKRCIEYLKLALNMKESFKGQKEAQRLLAELTS